MEVNPPGVTVYELTALDGVAVVSKSNVPPRSLGESPLTKPLYVTAKAGLSWP